MKKVSLKEKMPYIIAISMMVISMIIGVVYLNMKSGYYVDEGMTLVLSNGEFNGAVTSNPKYDFFDFVGTFVIKDSFSETVSNIKQMLTDVASAGNYSVEGTVDWYDAARSMLQGESTWISGDQLYNQLVAEKGNRFNYMQVYINQAVDVHPPIYYIVVHTIFSLFAGVYSKYLLFFVNIIFLSGTLILGFRMLTKQYGTNNAIPYLFIALYGFSQGFYSNAMYFRMYAMLTFFVLLTLYWHMMTEEYTKKRLRVLMAIVFAGFATQYYYILFLFPFFICNSISLIKSGRKTEFFRYLRAMIFTGIISLIVWPFSLYHILFGYRGTEAMKAIGKSGLFVKLLASLKVMKKAILLNSTVVAVIFWGIVLLAILLIIRKKKKLNKGNIYLAAGISTVFYYMVVTKIAPANSMRYYMCLHPIVVILFLVLAKEVIGQISDKLGRKNILIATGVMTAIYILVTFLCLTPDYLYLEERELKLGISDENSITDMNCLMIAMQHGEGFPVALKLSEYEEVMVVDEDKLGILATDRPTNSMRGMVIYIDKNCKIDEDISVAADYLELEKSAIIPINSDIAGFDAYLVDAIN